MVLNCRDWTVTQWTPSFKGVAFEVQDDGREAGRRLVVHEYPSREVWDVEDLGKRAETIEINGFLAGDNADLQSQRILQAFSSPDPGLLVLPNRPPIMARCLTIRSNWNADELGRMTFTASMTVEAQSPGGMISVGMLTSAVSVAARGALGAVSTLFATNFNTLMRRFSPLSIVPGVARDAAAVAIKQAGRRLEYLVSDVPLDDRKARSDIRHIIYQIQAQATWFAFVGQRGDRIAPMIYIRDQYGPVAQEFQDFWATACYLIVVNCVDWEALERNAIYLSNFRAPVTTSGPECRSVQAERELAEEVAVYVRRTGLLMRATATSRVRRVSRADSVEARADLARAFAAEIESIGDPPTYAAVIRTRDRALDLLARRGAQLPQTVMMNTIKPMPAAVLVAQLYDKPSEDADRELVERNRAVHPLFMPTQIEAIAERRRVNRGTRPDA